MLRVVAVSSVDTHVDQETLSAIHVWFGLRSVVLDIQPTLLSHMQHTSSKGLALRTWLKCGIPLEGFARGGRVGHWLMGSTHALITC